MQQILVITGPTASGKTGASIQVAKALGGEIVSADSMQIYRGMDIGTAKPTQDEMCGIRHHMLDVANPNEAYSVARYVDEAAICVDDILAHGKVPILVGGTGLYLDALLSGRYFAQSDDDKGLRDVLCARYDREGGQVLWEELREIDPDAAARLHVNDKKRVLRAIEVYRLTGETITAHNEKTQQITPRYHALKIALDATSREALYRRIDQRVDEMVERGLVSEVEALMQSGLCASDTAMQAIGYKEVAAYISGAIPFDAAIAQVKQESRRYAKRQLSWFRRDKTIHWIKWDDMPDVNIAREIIMEKWTDFCLRGLD